MQGKRRDITDNPIELQSGEYGKHGNTWWGHLPIPHPNDEFLPLVHLSRHDITEHEDGTITVSPSILWQHHSGRTWHGYLERGVWREV